MKIKHTNPLWMMVLAMVILWSCSEQEVTERPIQDSPELMTREAIDNFIIQSLQETDSFSWQQASDRMIWSALLLSDSLATVGYKPASDTRSVIPTATIDIRETSWSGAREMVIDEAVEIAGSQQGANFRVANMEIKEHEVLPFVEFKVITIETVRQLRQMPEVRYVEPLGYEVNFSTVAEGRTESDKGCSNSPDNSLTSGDFYTISPNAKVSWNYSYMNVEQAWNYSTGSGIGVGLIDTGISPDQTKLGSEFNSGLSGNRYIQKYGTYVSSWWWWASPDGPDDECGHGTAMAGVIASPRSNSGAAVGVAYNANLIAYRGTGDVIINSGREKTGVSDALVALGNRSDVQIISMSIGDVFYNSKVADAVRYAYGKGKLIFSAAGTSTSFTNWFGVIFPASMNETVAVTGIKEGSYQRCDICHSGSKVDFTIVMERSGTERKPLSLAMSGNAPSTVGGSSVATATAAGIAALVWGRNPGWSRDQVINRLIQTADFYPNRDGQFGWGTLNAAAAVQ